MTCLVYLSSGNVVIDLVDGRDFAAVRTWVEAQPQVVAPAVEVVAIDPSAAFRSAVRRLLPKARVSVDHFHLVKLANDTVTAVRRRVSWDRHDRRGRQIDLAWVHRLLLLRGYDTLSRRGRGRLDDVLSADNPTFELGAAWGVKEQLRLVLACTSLADARAARRRFDAHRTHHARTDAKEARRRCVGLLRPTRTSNGPTEAINGPLEHLRGSALGFRNLTSYIAGSLLGTGGLRTRLNPALR